MYQQEIAGAAILADDDAEIELYSNLSRGVAQLTQSEVAVPAQIAKPDTSTEQSPTSSTPPQPTPEDPKPKLDPNERIAAFGRERSGTTAFFNHMNFGAKTFVSSHVEDTDSKRTDSDSSDESEPEMAGRNRKRGERKTKQTSLELVREIIETRALTLTDKANNSETSNVTSTSKDPTTMQSVAMVESIFPAQPKALPLDIVSLILARSCMSPRDVGFLHLVCRSWTNMFGHFETGNPVWALWYKFHFGGGPFVSSNRMCFYLDVVKFIH